MPTTCNAKGLYVGTCDYFITCNFIHQSNSSLLFIDVLSEIKIVRIMSCCMIDFCPIFMIPFRSGLYF